MNEAVNRFLDEMGAFHAERGDRDVSPILFKADDENGGKVFELSLPKGEPHPYWRVREREMTLDEGAALTQAKRDRGYIPWTIGSVIPGSKLPSAWLRTQRSRPEQMEYQRWRY